MIFDCKKIEEILKENNVQSVLLVCDSFLKDSFLIHYLQTLKIKLTLFSDFKANPSYEEVEKGIKQFKKNNCDFIISMGGGSAIDVAKCIKAFVTMDENQSYLKQAIVENNIKHLAIPTTAGTGSEATQFAVVYYNNEKQSVDNDVIKPNYVYLEPKFLETLPLYQKKSTLLDALCQGIESYWSVNSTEESKEYAASAIKIILKNYKEYIEGNKETYKEILMAADYSGRAINISRTTAAHAMSYKITSLYGISHGHAVALCLPHIWEYMIHNINITKDPRGTEYLEKVFDDLDLLFGTKNHLESINKFNEIYNNLNLDNKKIVHEEDLDILSNSVNENRLKNNPVPLEEKVIKKIYKKI